MCIFPGDWIDFLGAKRSRVMGECFFNRNINSRLRVGFENFWRCFNKTKEKKQEPGDEHPHARRTQQSIFVIKEMFRKTEPHKKMSVIFQSDKGLSGKRWPVFASFRGCVAAGQIPANNDSS
jgi:hypothetical protein